MPTGPEDMASLSLADIARLAQNPSAATRADVAQKIGQQIEADQQRGREFTLAVEIANLLRKDAEQSVRAALADSLRTSEKAPHDLIFALAQDKSDEVASPILEHNTQLTDEDLGLLIQATHQMMRLLAVARRRKVSTAVAGALIDKKIEEISSTLLKNQGADLHKPQFMEIAENHYDSQTVMQGFMERKPVPVEAVKHMVDVSTNVTRHKLMNSRTKAAMEKSGTAESSIYEDINMVIGLGARQDEQACHALAERFNRSGALSPTFLALALMLGNPVLFIACMSCRSRVPYEKMLALYDGDEKEFKDFFQRSHLPYGMLKFFSFLKDSTRALLSVGISPNSMTFYGASKEKVQKAMEEKIPYADRVGLSAIELLEDFFRQGK